MPPPTEPMAFPSEGYDFWRGQLRLFDPTLLPLDERLTQFVRAYQATPAAERPIWRSSLTPSDGYMLLAFARRAALFAIRADDDRIVADGLGACAAIDTERVDERDVLVAIAILHHAIVRIGADGPALMKQAAIQASPSVGGHIEGFLAREPADQDLRDAWGHVEVAAPGGAGLLQWGFRRWTPSLDVAASAVDIADALSAERYQADDPMLAAELPEIWLSDAADPTLESTLAAARGTVLVNHRLRPSYSDDHASQQLTIWVVEVADALAATRLRSMSLHGRSGAALLGVAEGALFALVVARSWVEGVTAYESTDSLERLAAPISRALAGARSQSRRAPLLEP